MKFAKVMEAIEAAPTSTKTKNRLRTIASALNEIATLDHEQLSRVRHGLHLLKDCVSGPKADLIDSALFVMNKIGQEGRFDREPEHTITDHAFCAGLRRYYGVNLNALKDRMLAISQTENWVAVRRNQKIVTFYPKSTTA